MNYLLYVDDCLIIEMVQVSLDLRVLKDILDADSILRLHSLFPFRGHS